MGCGASTGGPQNGTDGAADKGGTDGATGKHLLGVPGPVDVIVSALTGEVLLQEHFDKEVCVKDLKLKVGQNACDLLREGRLLDDNIVLGTQPEGAPVNLECVTTDLFQMAFPADTKPFMLRVEGRLGVTTVPAMMGRMSVRILPKGEMFWVVQSWSHAHGDDEMIFWRLARSTGHVLGWARVDDPKSGNSSKLSEALNVFFSSLDTPDAILNMVPEDTDDFGDMFA